ncbi:hypothetical protein HDU93_001895 [Gonapodya sp. JEL0774]|nr:hypothetical protein HDU93_001895 [Gonapodya sp. JEL0774]
MNRAVLNPPGKVTDFHGQQSNEQAINAKKFFAQRNLYLTGSTLLMFYATNRYYSLMLRYLQTTGELEAKLKVAQRAAKVDVPTREEVTAVKETPLPRANSSGGSSIRGEELALEGLRKRS